jgi:hypothetical protein
MIDPRPLPDEFPPYRAPTVLGKFILAFFGRISTPTFVRPNAKIDINGTAAGVR